MVSDRGLVREVAWSEVAPWLILFRVVSLAFDPRKLVLAAAGIVLTWGGWYGVADLFSGSSRTDVKEQVGFYRTWLGDTPSPGTTSPAAGASSPAGESENFAVAAVRSAVRVISDVPVRLSRPFRDLFREDASLTGIAMSVLCALWALAVWSLFGGAITRIAAVQLTQEQRYGLVSAVRYAIRKWPSYFAAPLFPFAFVIGAMALTSLAGLVAQPSAGFVVTAIFWPVVLGIALLLVILLAALLVGWPLMFACVSVEGQDAFDAFHRLHAYVYQRAFQFLFYTVVAAVLGTLGWLVAWLLGEGVLYVAAWSTSWGSDAVRDAEIFSLSQLDTVGNAATAGGKVISFWTGLVQLLVLAFGYGYFWTAATAIYLLLRRDTDGMPLDNVYLETPVQPQPLPKIVADDKGVPVMAREEGEHEHIGEDAPPEGGTPTA